MCSSDLEPWLASGGWIVEFCSEMRELLLAELEVRLRPVIGLVESLPHVEETVQPTLEGKEVVRD